MFKNYKAFKNKYERRSRMNMKKLILWVLMCIMILSFTACGSKAETGEAAPFESGEQTTVITDETARFDCSSG